ncbi:hypothetical protein ACN47E_003407 [Coniothyrium glycines]
MPRGDPLADWKKENLAAPRNHAQRRPNIQPSIYENELPKPQLQVQVAERNHSARQAQPALPLAQADVAVVACPRQKKPLTEHDIAACPQRDTRWPPPNGSYDKPLHLFLDEKGEKRIYYYLVYQNKSRQASSWKQEIRSRAAHLFEKSQGAGTSTERTEQAAVMRMAIINAKNRQRLTSVSTGARGEVWILDEENMDVWTSIESIQQNSPQKAVNIRGQPESFEIFGLGLKGNKGDALLVSRPVGAA